MSYDLTSDATGVTACVSGEPAANYFLKFNTPYYGQSWKTGLFNLAPVASNDACYKYKFDTSDITKFPVTGSYRIDMYRSDYRSDSYFCRYRNQYITISSSPGPQPKINYKGWGRMTDDGYCNEFADCIQKGDIKNRNACILFHITTYQAGTYRITANYKINGVSESKSTSFTYSGPVNGWQMMISLNKKYVTGVYEIVSATITKV